VTHDGFRTRRHGGRIARQGPGQRDLVWAVDGTGEGVTRGVIGSVIDAASYPGTPVAVMSEIQAILGSVAVGEWG